VIDALSTSTGLSVRGTITNDFLSSGNATCGSSSFVLLAGGTAYQGTVYCADAEIAPGSRTHFEVMFPPVTMGLYYLRYQRTSKTFDIVPLRLRIKASS
jgi:hypothetical protein